MIKPSIVLAVLAAAYPASAQIAPLPGVWVVGEAASFANESAWVFLKEGHYAEVKLPDGATSAVGSWRDGGDSLAYTHAHVPFTKLAEGRVERRMVFKIRTADRFEAIAPSGTVRMFSRCPDETFKAPKTAAAH